MKQQWPADKIEKWEISKLIPYARNSRVHSQIQIDQLAASIETWGWTMPCLVAEDGVLIAGHGRILAARQLGIEYIPVMIARGWTDSQVKAYRIADNKLTENSAWDFGMLALEIEDLKADDFDISLAGFADSDEPKTENDIIEEYQDMPEFNQENLQSYHRITMHFKDDEGIAEFGRLIGQTLTKKNKYCFFPQGSDGE